MNAKVRRGVAAYEIIIGLVAFVAASVSRAEVGWLQITIALIGGALSFVAGALLWRDVSFGRSLSLIVQAVQVPQIALSGVVLYGVSLGAALTPYIGIAPQEFKHAIYSSLRIGSQVRTFYLGVNLLALAALVLLAMRATHQSSSHIAATA